MKGEQILRNLGQESRYRIVLLLLTPYLATISWKDPDKYLVTSLMMEDYLSQGSKKSLYLLSSEQRLCY